MLEVCGFPRQGTVITSGERRCWRERERESVCVSVCVSACVLVSKRDKGRHRDMRVWRYISVGWHIEMTVGGGSAW